MVDEVHALPPLDPRHVEVDHRGLHRLVTEPLLDGLYVLARLQQVCCMGMAQAVRRKRGVKPRKGEHVPQPAAYVRVVDGPDASELLEHEVHARVCPAVCREHLQCLRGDWHDAVLAALALPDVDLAPVERDVSPAQAARLEGTQPAVVDDGEQRLGVQLAGAKQKPHLLHGKDFRKLPLPADLGKRQVGKVGMPHGAQVALQAVDEVLELGDGRLRLAREHPSHVAVGILLGELLGQLA